MMEVAFPIDVPEDCPFGLQNIPWGIFSTAEGIGRGAQRRAGTAIGNYILALDVLVKNGVFDRAGLTKSLGDVFLKPDLNAFASLPASDRSLIRTVIIENLNTESSILFTNQSLNEQAFVQRDQARMHMPMAVGDYTDFFCSYTHAKNCEALIGGSIPKPFYEYPMGYNGRISSVAVSGTDVIRPKGFWPSNGATHSASYQPTQKLDFEMEMGVFVSKPIEPGKVVSARDAAEHVFGYVLLNDWSARDIQGHEMFPFGPFHSKSFLTSISPWVVTLDALRGSQCKIAASHANPISSILRCDENDHGLFDVELSVHVSREHSESVKIIETKMADAFWSAFQMIAYQSSSGCGLRTGDLLGSGTLSSPARKNSPSTNEKSISTFGCLSEINACGHLLPHVAGRPLSWLEDGDHVTMEGRFKTADARMAGFGPLQGLVVSSTK